MPTSLLGVGSGIDLGTLVDQLGAAERASIPGIKSRVQATQRQLTTVGTLTSKLSALETAVKDLDSSAEVRAVSASSTDETRVKVAASGAAVSGSYDVTVKNLARAQSNRSSKFSANEAGIVGTGSLTIRVGSASAVTVDYDEDSTLDTIASAINSSGARVSASVIYDGTDYQLVVSGKDTGAANAITFSETGDSIGFLSSQSLLTAAQDSEISVNGLAGIKRSTNQLSDVISGVTFSLLSTTPSGGASTRVEIKDDPDGLRNKVKKMVDAYNDVINLVNGQLKNDEADKKAAQSMFGDSTLQGLQRAGSTVMGGAYSSGSASVSLSAYGVAIQRDGTLLLDQAKFDAAVAKDSDGLVALFSGTGASNLSGSIKALVTRYAEPKKGALAAKTASLNSRVKALNAEVDAVEERATRVTESLKKQFSNLDAKVAAFQSQGSYIARLFG